MANLASPPHPAHALLCWIDDRHVYICVPVKNNPIPLIQSYPLHEAGLSKALNFLRTRYEELPSYEKNYTAPSAPISSKNGKPPVQSDAERTQALAVLRKMGLV
jgi:hypothetical protein